MAKVSEEGRAKLKEALVPYKNMVTDALAKEKSMRDAISQDKEGSAYKKIQLAEHLMALASYYIAQNSLSVKMIDVRDNDILNDARKVLYKAVISLEEVVTDYIDASFTEIAEKRADISNISVPKRYALVQKLGLTINIMEDAFGANSKWKSSFVELDGRYSVVVKNLLDMKQAVKDYFDPNSENYETTVLYMRLLGRLIDYSADAYRDKYVQASRRIDDMKNGIRFLLARRNIFAVLGDSNGAEEMKKKAIVWKENMEKDKKSGAAN